MKKSRRVLQTIVECLVVFVLVVMSVVGTGSITVPVSQVRPHLPASSAPATASGVPWSPGASPAALPTSAWYAPGSAMSGPLYGPYIAGGTTTPQKRKPGEQPDLRTANSDTILNPNGTWTLKEYDAPINYKDAQGHWQPIDDTLISDTSDSGYAYGNRANAWHVHFAAQAGGASLVHALFPGVKVAETLDGAAQVRAALNGSSAVYAGVFPGVDLRYGVGAQGLEETLLLQSAGAPASYTFTYHIPGASVKEDAAGNVVVTDAKGAVLLVIGSLLMFESDQAGQLLPNGAASERIALTLSGSGPDFQVTYTPDHAWVTDPKRHFPVALDPTWQSSDPQTNTTSGNVYGDTIDESGNPTTQFYNLNAERIGNGDIVGLCCNGVSRAYLKFPINPPPTQVRITSADLALYQYSHNSGGGVQIQANAILSAWNETTLDWNNHPTSFETVATANTAAPGTNWVHFDVSAAVQEWWSGGIALNGLELQYTDETQKQEWFISDDNVNTSEHPLLTINYVQDTTAPGGGLSFNSGATSTSTPAVTVAPAGSDAGSTQEWSSNWTTVNGVSTNRSFGSADWSVDATHAQLLTDTAGCGATACWTQTFFTHTVNSANWPTFTAAFKTDSTANFQFGAVSNDNVNTRFVLVGSASGFTSLQYSTAAGQFSTTSVTTIPFSANTWYYGQVEFPLPGAGEIYIWPVGQARPTTPSAAYAGIVMTNPGLNVFLNGDNGANLHHAWIGNVQMTSKASSSTGYGIYGMQLSSDGTTYGCPVYAGGAFSGGPWCVYSGQSFPWTFPTGDGKKTLWFKYIDNAGNSISGSSQIILDTVAPTVNSITLGSGNPAQGSEVRGIVTLSVHATDPLAPDGSCSGVASAILYVDGVQAGTGVTGASAPTFYLDTTTLAPGEHVLTAKATDAAGNTSAIGGSTTIIVSNTALMPYETLAKRTLPDGQTDVSVNVANGDAVVTHQDLDVPGLGPDLALGRTYHAQGGLSGLFGAGWTSDLDERLTINGDGSLTYRDPAGGIHVFLPNGSGGYLTSPGLYLMLVQNGDGSYTLKARDQSKTNFTTAGYLSSFVDRNGNTLTVSYSGLLPTTVTDAAGREYSITITNGHVTQITAPGVPAPRTYNYGYDGNGNLTSYTDPSGVVTQYGYDGSHRLTSITLNYVSGGAQDQQTNVTTTLAYDTNPADLAYNRLTGLTDPMGYQVHVTYSIPSGGSALQTQVAQQQGISPSVTYETTTYLLTTDGLGAVATLTDALGHASQYQYDANGNVTQATDPDGHVVTSTYDGNGNTLTQVVDPGTGHLNLTTTWTYDSSNNVLTATDPRAIETQYTYDTPSTTGHLLKRVQNYVQNGPTNSDTNVTTTSTYDSFGEMLTQTDPLGIVTKYTYDSQGDVLTTTANYVANGPTDSQTNVTTSATYDVLGERITSTNPLGIVTQNGYDILGNLLQTVANYRASGPTDQQTNVKTMYGYDALGRQVTVTNPLGIVTLTTYDKDGRVTQTTRDYVSGGAHDNQTNVVVSTATYDAAGNTLTATDAKGNVTITVYDLDNRATQVTVEDNATPTPDILQNSKTVYDAAGLIVETDTLSLDGTNTIQTKVTYTYDNAGRQASKTDPPASSTGGCGVLCTSNVTTTTYDADGNALDSKETNAALGSPSIVTESTATFDHLNRPLTKTEQAGTTSAQTTTFTYDLDGRQHTMVDPANQTTTMGYDALGRTLSVTHPDTTVDTSTYDAAGEHLTQVNSAGTTSDTYDALGRVLEEDHHDGSGTFQSSVSYSYDANGNKLQVVTVYPGPITTIYNMTYDKLDRPLTMSDGARSYTYDINGNVTQMQVLNASQANIISQSITYDGENRVSTLNVVANANPALHNYSYLYDAFGNRHSITDSVPGTTTTYLYDQLQQLTSVQVGSASATTYTYDANGNRTRMQVGTNTPTTYTYDNADVELKSKTDPNGKVTNYTYDTNGNLTQAVYDPGSSPHLNQTTTYKYDTVNRLTEVDEPSGTVVKFAYNADGNRVQKKVTSGSTTTTINDVYAQGHLVEQTDGTGAILAAFTYDTKGTLTSVVLGNPSSGPRYYYAYDVQGNVVDVTDSSGNVVASYAYDTFGGVTATENFPNGWSNPFRYDGAQGVRYDSETGLYWMSVRAYDPTLGRFLSHDPLGRLAAAGLNAQPYVYAGNNPVNNTDPTGLMISGGTPGQTGTLTYTQQQSSIQVQKKLHPNAPTFNAPPQTPSDPTTGAKNVASMGAGNFKDAALAALQISGLLAAAAIQLVVASELMLVLAAADLTLPFVDALAPALIYLAGIFEDAALVVANLSEVAAGIAAEDFTIAGMFAAESGNSKSWWTAANVETFRLQAQAVRYGFEYGVIGLMGVRKLFGLTVLRGITSVLNSALTFFVNDQAVGSQIDWYTCLEKLNLGGTGSC